MILVVIRGAIKIMICPRCQSLNIVKNGHIHNGKPKCACKDCNRQFVENSENRIPQSKKDLIDKLLLERIPLAGIARVVGVSERWLQGYVNRKYQEVPRQIDVKKSLKESW
jgi:transposase-like protein